MDTSDEEEKRIRTNMVVLEKSDAVLFKRLENTPPKARAAQIRYLAHLGALVEDSIKNGHGGGATILAAAVSPVCASKPVPKSKPGQVDAKEVLLIGAEKISRGPLEGDDLNFELG